MEKRLLGKTGMQVSILGFGGAEIGADRASIENVSRLLNSALDAGLNVIDTAECYSESESLIGETVSHRRNEYYLFTKCGHSSGIDLPDWDIKMLGESLDRSLQRLKTDYVDLLQLHTCSEERLRQGTVIEFLQRAQQAGKTRYIGYSGDNQAARYAVECGAFDTLQASINIADQQAIELTLPIAHEKNIGVIAKRPVANIAWRYENKPSDNYHVEYWKRLQTLDYEFLRGDIQQAVGIALRFALSQQGVHTAIVGTSNPDRWLQNAKLLEAGMLSNNETQAIRDRWRQVAQADWDGQS